MIWWLTVAALLMISTRVGRTIGAWFLSLGFVVFVLYCLAFVVGCGMKAGWG